jgi:hypothetical protein
MIDPRLIPLREIADLSRTQAIGRLEANKRAEAEIEDQIAALRHVVTTGTLDAFQAGGGEAIWCKWRDQKITLLNQQRARLRVAREALSQEAARAVARVQVLDRLIGSDG